MVRHSTPREQRVSAARVLALHSTTTLPQKVQRTGPRSKSSGLRRDGRLVPSCADNLRIMLSAGCSIFSSLSSNVKIKNTDADEV